MTTVTRFCQRHRITRFPQRVTDHEAGELVVALKTDTDGNPMREGSVGGNIKCTIVFQPLALGSREAKSVALCIVRIPTEWHDVNDGLLYAGNITHRTPTLFGIVIRT